MGFLRHIERCHAYDLTGFRPFSAAGQRVGWVRHRAAERLSDWPVFDVSTDAVALSEQLDGFDARSEAMAAVVVDLARAGDLPARRGEMFPVTAGAAEKPLLQIDRSAISYFGVVAYGVHLNGFVRKGETTHLWIGRRAQTVNIEPGKLDNLVAGGQPIGLGFKENLVKEAGEEANVPPALAAQAVPVGAISYTRETPAGLKPDVLMIYDLELPPDFVPRNTDGEIEGFELCPVEGVLATVREGFAFKFNVSLVLIDFGIRHGFIGPEESDYLALCQGLRQPAP